VGYALVTADPEDLTEEQILRLQGDLAKSHGSNKALIAVVRELREENEILRGENEMLHQEVRRLEGE